MEFYHHGIKGQRWGVRRYQNADGSLTSAGQKRYDRDVRENNAKKKENRINIDGPDPQRWAKEDLNRSTQVVKTSNNLIKELQKVEQSTRKPLDLSNMSDKELRERINRQLLEKQYNQMFADISPSKVSKGRETVKASLEVIGTVLAVGTSALEIAKTIKELRG